MKTTWARLKKTLAWLAVTAIFTFPLLSLPGAMDMFLKLEGIDGESTDTQHKNEIDVLAWSWGMSQSGSFHVGSGSTAGKANFQDLSVTKWVDKSSPILMLHCANGKHIPKATLTVRSAGKNPLEFISFEMSPVMVTSVAVGGSAGEDRITENITLNFRQLKFEYTPQALDGTGGPEKTFEWDILENTGSGG